MEFLRHSLVKRAQFNIPKRVAEPIAVYDFQQECQSIEELDQIQDNDDRLCIEALLIQERVLLLQKDERPLTPLFERATALVEQGQFDRCFDLILHIFCLCQPFELHTWLKPFFWIFTTKFK